MRAQPKASHYIGGSHHESDGEVIESRYPATGEVIAEVRAADDDTIDRAVVAAREGFAAWSATPADERGRILRRAADIIRDRNSELSELETLDTGKALQETLVVDPTSGAESLEFFGSLAATATGRYIELEGAAGGSFAYTRREPLGICVGIGAWNYPIQIACWKGAPALAAGNAMIFKPSDVTPLSALAVAEILTEAGVPDGVYNVVQGRGDVGADLVQHPDVAKVSVTGSVPTGTKVMAGAAAGLKHVTLELGGKSPLIVFDDADLDNAVSGAMLGNFYSTGQVCSNGTRVFVQRAVYDDFLDRVVRRTQQIRLGDPLDEATQMGPLVSQAQFDRVLDYLAIGRNEGARALVGGDRAVLPGLDGGWFVEPTVLVDVTDDMRVAREEIFGPVMCVMPFDDEDEVVERANDTEYGLSAGVFSRDIQRAHRVIARLEAGSCWINTYNLTPTSVPFGGVKRSGIGRENGHAALDHYSQWKSVYVEAGDVDSPY
ncbi:MAG: betaine-aldehyde dehydrogenase [Ilumatobacter sp.]|uniref:betaine-aldehyde dehydrogenase n=1 Tax=Ilumatobacter sp. TaxID=1967498 RepID=UPI00261D183A|nr:betaine-aldehyde dehydrogenase [Ilumatobacter sp.]MDJ0771800.1 betaine-aldehyde dehydrogenase [Ilumatobacter sp.]